MECIVQAFQDEYNIQCMDKILKSATHLDEAVDVRELFIILMENQPDIMQSINQPGGIKEPNKYLELQLVLMKFTIKCYPQNVRLATVNQVLEKTKYVLNAYNR